jgi:hypothetical protein
MKHRIWRSSPTTLIGYILSLSLFIFLFVYLQGAVIGAAIPDSPGEFFLRTSKSEIVTAEKLSKKAYLPIVLTKLPIKTFPPVSKGSLSPEDLIISSLAMETADRWTMNFLSGDQVTITVAPGKQVDLVLSILDNKGGPWLNNKTWARQVR